MKKCVVLLGLGLALPVFAVDITSGLGEDRAIDDAEAAQLVGTEPLVKKGPEMLTTETRLRLPLPVCESLGPKDTHRRYDVPIQLPESVAGRRVVVSFSMLNTRAEVSLDGRTAGICVFPGGEVELTRLVRPGKRQNLVLDVTALPLTSETEGFNAPDRSEKRRSKVRNRGITDAVWIDAFPSGGRIVDACAITSVSRGKIAFLVETEGFGGKDYRLSAAVEGCGTKRTFASGALTPDASGKIHFAAAWPDAQLWDTHTPTNLYTCALTLRDAAGRVVDAAFPFRFGFREVTLRGRDILLNGTPIHLRAQHDVTVNRPGGSKTAALAHARDLLSRGWNFVIALNYDFSPGCIAALDGMLDACDETGLLYSFTLPSLKDFGERALRDDEATRERYRRLTQWAIRRVRNHPSVLTYAMNHNVTGYAGDMDPLRIGVGYDLVSEIEKDPVAAKNLKWIPPRRRTAEWCRGVAKELDPTRPVYHHESGDLGEFHTCNIYLDWAPRQERSDWLEDWSARGVKPVFFVEWGCPHIANWSSYRGPLFIWRKNAYHSLLASEYAAEIRGDAAYDASGSCRAALDREEELWARGKPFHWYQLLPQLKAWPSNYHAVVAHYLSDNWRSHRAWGISALLPWDQGCDFDDAGNPTERAKAFARWNRAECAFIGGDKPFTDKRRNYRPGETVRKTLVVLNDRRTAARVAYRAALRVWGQSAEPRNCVEGTVDVPPGCRRDVPVRFTVPDGATGGSIDARFDFGNGVRQSDAFRVEVVAAQEARTPDDLLLFDPKGLTKREFDRIGVRYRPTDLSRPLPQGARLVVGREALTAELHRTRIRPLLERSGRVLVFEQTAETLADLGFRVQKHGLRRIFTAGRGCVGHLNADRLTDWAGESTLLPPYLENVPDAEVNYNTECWAGFSNTRVWRCRQRGTVASVLPERPPVGDWRALCVGGFALEYAPLLEQVAQKGRVLWCQLDVTGRTTADPYADEIVKSLVASLKGDCRGGKRVKPLDSAAFHVCRRMMLDFEQDPEAWTARTGKDVFLAMSGAVKPQDLDSAVKEGAKVLCLGFSAAEVRKWSPVPIAVAETNGCYYSRLEKIPPELDGLLNADWAWHGKMDFAAFLEPAEDGNEAFRVVRHGSGAYVFWQVPPMAIDDERRPYLRVSKRHAWLMLSRLLHNLGAATIQSGVAYCDAPVADDDPYLYYRW